MNSIRILNDNEISLNFRLIYFMICTVQFPRKYMPLCPEDGPEQGPKHVVSFNNNT
jgi:hypothetical protein